MDIHLSLINSLNLIFEYESYLPYRKSIDKMFSTDTEHIFKSNDEIFYKFMINILFYQMKMNDMSVAKSVD
jgi:hypothetical protein